MGKALLCCFKPYHIYRLNEWALFSENVRICLASSWMEWKAGTRQAAASRSCLSVQFQIFLIPFHIKPWWSWTVSRYIPSVYKIILFLIYLPYSFSLSTKKTCGKDWWCHYGAMVMIYSFCFREVIATISHFVRTNYFCYFYIVGLFDGSCGNWTFYLFMCIFLKGCQ